MRLLDRDSELEQLSAALDESKAGGRIVIIRGEAGIGKTALAREFASRCPG